jgi:hypothetical protein
VGRGRSHGHLSALLLAGRRVVAAPGDDLVGHVRGVLFTVDGSSAAGFEVELLSGRSCFLPWPLAVVGAGEIRVSSRAHLIEDPSFYRAHGGPAAPDAHLDPESGRVLRRRRHRAP